MTTTIIVGVCMIIGLILFEIFVIEKLKTGELK